MKYNPSKYQTFIQKFPERLVHIREKEQLRGLYGKVGDPIPWRIFGVIIEASHLLLTDANRSLPLPFLVAILFLYSQTPKVKKIK